ncbi:MAG TPA: GNAT family N-acetyltransferase [Gemmatimonadaceae bacterium]|nr:GNAT family N-acetyltransferase [Gemmatimonadaceae bacterium]
MPVPLELRTARLLLRPWRDEDAPALLPVLEANQAHLGPWIPARVATPVLLPALAERLAAFAADFAADREWRYGLFTPDGATVVGEVDLLPRAASGRVAFAEADHVEIGYWLRRDRVGQGLATEAAAAMLGVARTLPGLTHVEIRCDARNAASAAVPRRLGFRLDRTVDAPGVAGDAAAPVALQVWVRALGQRDETRD